MVGGVHCEHLGIFRRLYMYMKNVYIHVELCIVHVICSVLCLCMYLESNHSIHCIRESVDSLCRDGSDPRIVCVHWKAFLTRERLCSKRFWAPSYTIPAFLYLTVPPKYLKSIPSLTAGKRRNCGFLFLSYSSSSYEIFFKRLFLKLGEVITVVLSQIDCNHYQV